MLHCREVQERPGRKAIYPGYLEECLGCISTICSLPVLELGLSLLTPGQTGRKHPQSDDKNMRIYKVFDCVASSSALVNLHVLYLPALKIISAIYRFSRLYCGPNPQSKAPPSAELATRLEQRQHARTTKPNEPPLRKLWKPKCHRWEILLCFRREPSPKEAAKTKAQAKARTRAKTRARRTAS